MAAGSHVHQGRRVHRFNVNFTEEAWTLLQGLADRRDRTISDVIRDAVALEHWFEETRREGARVLIERDGSVREVVLRP